MAASRSTRLARLLGVLTLVLAWSAAGVTYWRTGEITWGLVAAGVVFAALGFSLTSRQP